MVADIVIIHSRYLLYYICTVVTPSSLISRSTLLPGFPNTPSQQTIKISFGSIVSTTNLLQTYAHVSRIVMKTGRCGSFMQVSSCFAKCTHSQRIFPSSLPAISVAVLAVQSSSFLSYSSLQSHTFWFDWNNYTPVRVQNNKFNSVSFGRKIIFIFRQHGKDARLRFSIDLDCDFQIGIFGWLLMHFNWYQPPHL